MKAYFRGAFYSIKLAIISFLFSPLVTAAQSCPGNAYCVTNPLGDNTSFCGLIIKLLNAAMVIGAPIAVLLVVYAGFKFVAARGNTEALASARSNLIYTLIGIAIFFGASLIASVIIGTLQGLGVNGIQSC
ncbi:MAG: hypothetical protein KGJ34_02490 [Patescibacteria group bacterium]|nr:hypothetical protein [Patescibacteria group bacterium]